MQFGKGLIGHLEGHAPQAALEEDAPPPAATAAPRGAGPHLLGLATAGGVPSELR